MKDKIISLLTAEQMEIYEQNKEKENLAINELRRWAEPQAEQGCAMIEHEQVIAKFIELIQSDLKVEPTPAVEQVNPLAKKEVKEVETEVKEPKPPKKKEVKDWKREMQNAFEFEISEEVEIKPIWEM